MDFLFSTQGHQLDAIVSNPMLSILAQQQYQMTLHVDAEFDLAHDIILKVSQLADNSFKMLGMPILNGGPKRTFMFEIKGSYDFLINIRQVLGVDQLDEEVDEEHLHMQDLAQNIMMNLG